MEDTGKTSSSSDGGYTPYVGMVPGYSSAVTPEESKRIVDNMSCLEAGLTLFPPPLDKETWWIFQRKQLTCTLIACGITIALTLPFWIIGRRAAEDD